MARKTRIERLKDLLMDTYRELYENSTPSVDFDLLVETAEVTEDGIKVIPYQDYYIDEDKYKEIVNKNIAKMKMTKAEENEFRMVAFLGCGPSTSKKEEITEEEET